MFENIVVFRIAMMGFHLYVYYWDDDEHHVGSFLLTNVSEMQKVADPADVSELFISAGAKFRDSLGNIWPFLEIFGKIG